MNLTSMKNALRDPKRWKRWAIEALILIAIVAAIAAWRNSGLASGVAPPLAGVRTDGSMVELGAGKTARLVVFWATWCRVCRAEAGNIEAVARDWPVISVAMQSGDLTEISAYLKERGLVVPAVADDDSDIAEAWGVSVVPTHFFIDPAGNIRFRTVGYTTRMGLRARLWWAQTF
ncbi:MAG: protein disulfide oxidoreductase [Sulfuritalea sp.]|nr:protein disulfide oxidoreductase [Sulfuritalea sp.]